MRCAHVGKLVRMYGEEGGLGRNDFYAYFFFFIRKRQTRVIETRTDGIPGNCNVYLFNGLYEKHIR